MYTTQQKEE